MDFSYVPWIYYLVFAKGLVLHTGQSGKCLSQVMDLFSSMSPKMRLSLPGWELSSERRVSPVLLSCVCSPSWYGVGGQGGCGASNTNVEERKAQTVSLTGHGQPSLKTFITAEQAQKEAADIPTRETEWRA